jgi:hypothetical protein
MTKEIINEGLRPLDLKDLVLPMFSIDTFRSKMGEDVDVCVLGFSVKDRYPARDLMEFIEKGFNFVLDADVSSGENSKGEYHVFVELDRTNKIPDQIRELIYGINKLSGLSEWKFIYHKDKKTYDLSEDNLEKIVPTNPRLYEQKMNQIKVESLQKFFSKTLMDDLTLENDCITIHKPFNQKIHLKWCQEDDPQKIVETAPSIDESSTAEIFWLTKVLGDYDISKFGDKLLFTNGDRAMILQRTDK